VLTFLQFLFLCHVFSLPLFVVSLVCLVFGPPAANQNRRHSPTAGGKIRRGPWEIDSRRTSPALPLRLSNPRDPYGHGGQHGANLKQHSTPTGQDVETGAILAKPITARISVASTVILIDSETVRFLCDANKHTRALRPPCPF
jgi:hypothetical protein